MPDDQLQRAWPDPPPGPEPLPGTRALTVLHALRAGGWLRPRRIGCLLIVLVVLIFAGLWAVGSAINGIAAVLRNDPGPVAGSPFDTVGPTTTPSGPPGVDLITEGKLIVAVQDAPGLAERAPGSGSYTGFDIALLALIARDLGVDPADTNFKPVPASSGVSMLKRGEADLALGGFEITPQRIGAVSIVGPYLVNPLRLAVPSNGPVTGLDSLGDGQVCATRDSQAAAALVGRLGEQLKTRASLSACANLLGGAVRAIAGDEVALRSLPATTTGELRLVGEPLGNTEYGIAVAPDDDVLRERVNTVLRTAIDDGTWARLYAEYLGTPVPDPPTIR